MSSQEIHRCGSRGAKPDDFFTQLPKTMTELKIDEEDCSASKDFTTPPNRSKTLTYKDYDLFVQGTLFSKFKEGGFRTGEFADHRPKFDSTEIFALKYTPIHPLLSADQFQGPIRYEVLRPGLELASRLLESPRSLEYLHALFLSPVHQLPHPNQKSDSSDFHEPKTYRSVFREGEPLNELQIAQVHRKLLDMVLFVKFGVGKFPRDSVKGHCIPQYTQKAESQSGPEHSQWCGVGSEIVLSSPFYESLQLLYDSIEPDSYAQMRERLLTEALLLAKLLCHELCHAIMLARFGHSDIAFEQESFTEHGFQWEVAVLGGVVDHLNGNLWITEFPSPSLFESYIRNMCGMKLAAVPEQDVQVAWLAPIDSIARLFNPSFWNAKIKAAGADAVLIPKVCGYRWVPRIARGLCRCFACQRSEAIVEYQMKAIEHRDKSVLYNCIDKIKSTFARKDDSTATGKPQDQPESSSVKGQPSPTSPVSNPLLAPPGLVASPDDTPDSESEAPLPDCQWQHFVHWPFGPCEPRLHGLAEDMMTYGVPRGFTSLLDGTLVPIDKKEQWARAEMEDAEEDMACAIFVLECLEEVERSGFAGCEEEEDGIKRLQVTLSEMMSSEDAAVRRMIGGIPDVVAAREANAE